MPLYAPRIFLQKHEEYNYGNDVDGARSTAERCWRQFKKMFPNETKDLNKLRDALIRALSKEGMWGKEVSPSPGPKTVNTKTGSQKLPERTLIPFPFTTVQIGRGDNVREVVSGEEYEMCKTLRCEYVGAKPIEGKGRLNTSNLFTAVCMCQDFPDSCPQRASFTGQEEIQFELFKEIVGEEKARVLVLRTRLLNQVQTTAPETEQEEEKPSLLDDMIE